MDKYTLDLEDAALKFAFEINDRLWSGGALMIAFKAGAKWNKSINTEIKKRPDPLPPSGPGRFVKMPGG